jgi:hypothetical protein
MMNINILDLLLWKEKNPVGKWQDTIFNHQHNIVVGIEQLQ